MSVNHREQELEVLRDELLEAGFVVLRPGEVTEARLRITAAKQLLALPTEDYTKQGLATRIHALRRIMEAL